MDSVPLTSPNIITHKPTNQYGTDIKRHSALDSYINSTLLPLEIYTQLNVIRQTN